jgi:hypothetical protein
MGLLTKTGHCRSPQLSLTGIKVRVGNRVNRIKNSLATAVNTSARVAESSHRKSSHYQAMQYPLELLCDCGYLDPTPDWPGPEPVDG